MTKLSPDLHETSQKHRYFVKPTVDSNIRHLLVPKPMSNWKIGPNDITNKLCQTRVENPIDILNILLWQNFQHLMKYQYSIFTTQQIQKLYEQWNE